MRYLPEEIQIQPKTVAVRKSYTLTAKAFQGNERDQVNKCFG